MSEKQPPKRKAVRKSRDPRHAALDRQLDEALESTYPASDPLALVMPHRGKRTGE